MNDDLFINKIDELLDDKFDNVFDKVDYVETNKDNKIMNKYTSLILSKVDKELGLDG